MKALLVVMLVFLGAITALAYGRADVSAGVAAVVSHFRAGEPTALLVSGGALLVLAGALRRFTF